MKLEYSSNNSGGGWWLTDDHWRAMEAAGWDVEWVKDKSSPFMHPGADRWLGALATDASIQVASHAEAATRVNEWESITGQSADAEGCSCCGRPHYFALYGDDGKYPRFEERTKEDPS